MEKFTRYKLPDIDQILADMIQAEDKAFHSDVHKLITLIRLGMRNKNATGIEGIYYTCL